MRSFPCVTVYMSSMTNMAVAVDRYRVIVKHNSLQVSRAAAFVLVPVIFLVSAGLSLPIALYSKLVPLNVLLVGY